jgi:hypothetical protein
MAEGVAQSCACTSQVMTKPAHLRLSDLRGFQRLAIDATVGLTELVEAMHHTVVRTPGVLGKSPTGRSAGITGLVYKSVRGITRGVGVGVDALLGALQPLLADRPSSEEREAVLAALNGIFGDYLTRSGNPLAISMDIRRGGMPVALHKAALAAAFPEPARKIVVLIHGLCMNDLQWSRDGHDHGAALARDLGYAPVYLHYNTGQHVSTNGRELAGLIQTLLGDGPVRAAPGDRRPQHGRPRGAAPAPATRAPVMRGRSACELVFLGRLRRAARACAGAWVDFLIGISPYTAPFARLGNIRSAGIRTCVAVICATRTGAPPPARETHKPCPFQSECAATRCRASATGDAAGARSAATGLCPSRWAKSHDATLDLAFPESRRWVGYGMGHLDLLSHRDVYERMRSWLESSR